MKDLKVLDNRSYLILPKLPLELCLGSLENFVGLALRFTARSPSKLQVVAEQVALVQPSAIRLVFRRLLRDLRHLFLSLLLQWQGCVNEPTVKPLLYSTAPSLLIHYTIKGRIRKNLSFTPVLPSGEHPG